MNYVQTAMLLLGVFLLMGCEDPSDLETTDVGDDTATVSDVSDGDTAADDADGEPDDASSSSDDDGIWRSALYPEDWAPGDTDEEGRFLHDFSYAGYRHGEELPDDIAGELVDVTDFEADPTGENDTTEAIQQAIDTVEADEGGVVYVPEGLYRVDDRL